MTLADRMEVARRWLIERRKLSMALLWLGDRYVYATEAPRLKPKSPWLLRVEVSSMTIEYGTEAPRLNLGLFGAAFSNNDPGAEPYGCSPKLSVIDGGKK